MGGTIIHTISKDVVPGSGEGQGIGHYGPRTKRKKRTKNEPVEILHWTTYADGQKLLRKQSNRIEVLVILPEEALESKTARHGLSLNSAEFAARQAGFNGGKEITKSVDKAGACLVARNPDRYMFKGNLVLAKRP